MSGAAFGTGLSDTQSAWSARSACVVSVLGWPVVATEGLLYCILLSVGLFDDFDVCLNLILLALLCIFVLPRCNENCVSTFV